MSQHDMLEHEKLDTSLLKYIPEPTEGDPLWPSVMIGLYEILGEELDDRDQILKLVLNVGLYMGGVQHYLPSGDKLRKFVRNMKIYREFNGRNVRQLARKHKLSDKAVYEIIAKMRQAEIKRRQMQLF